MQGNASLLSMVMFGCSCWNAATSSSQPVRSFGLLFGGSQPTVMVTLASAPPELCAAGLSSDPQDAAARPSPATSSKLSALRWLVVLIDLPFCCEGDVRPAPLMWATP
ncbi:hypothetical protein [Kribbella qitaiheensis]|uniref:hypothetical protein n=1 Tax=Kribbella qitaiheensis TaxID=1544730 RepID=UPI001FECE23F|nr:hypothetical protein [Kribbella qitaiheensis]